MKTDVICFAPDVNKAGKLEHVRNLSVFGLSYFISAEITGPLIEEGIRTRQPDD